MTHRRQDIRELIVGYVTGLTTTGSSVTIGRTYDQDDLPSIDVTTPREVFDANDENRTLVVEIVLRAKAATPAEVLNQLDQVASEVEEAIDANSALDGDCGDMFLSEMDTEIESTADQPTGLMTLSYNVIYQYTAP